MVERALRNVVREALSHAATRGLPGEHHFYVTFATRHPGVEIPDYLRQRYPDEMTIVIQYQYHGLEVSDERFAVTLSFNNVHERLSVPMAAITTFADPSVNFALQFQMAPVEGAPAEAPPDEAGTPARAQEPAESGDQAPAGKVVTLDSFRKK